MNEIVYDDKALGETLILIYVQSIFFGEDLKVSLIPKNNSKEGGNILYIIPN